MEEDKKIKEEDKKIKASESSLRLFHKLARLGGTARVRGLTSGGLHYWCEVRKTLKDGRICWICYDDTASEMIATDKNLYYEALGIAVVEFGLMKSGEFEDPEGFRTYDIVQRMLMYTCPKSFLTTDERLLSLPKDCVYIVYTANGKYQEIRRL